MVRLAHPLFGEVRRATAGEMYLSRIRGRLAQRLAKDGDADSLRHRATGAADPGIGPAAGPAAVRGFRAVRHDVARSRPGRPVRPRRGGCGCDGGDWPSGDEPCAGRPRRSSRGRSSSDMTDDGDHWATVRAANLTWMLARPSDAAALLAELPETAERLSDRGMRGRGVGPLPQRGAKGTGPHWLPEPSTDFHAMVASVALTMAMGALGHVDDLPPWPTKHCAVRRRRFRRRRCGSGSPACMRGRAD